LRAFSVPGPNTSEANVDLYIELDLFAPIARAIFSFFAAVSGAEDSPQWPSRRRFPVFEVDSIVNSPLPNEGRNTHWQEDPGRLWKKLIGGSSPEDLSAIVRTLQKSEAFQGSEGARALEVTEDFVKAMNSLTGSPQLREIRGELYWAAMFSQHLRYESCPVTELFHHGWPNWYQQYISHSIAVSLFGGVEPRLERTRDDVDYQKVWSPQGDNKSVVESILGGPQEEVSFGDMIEMDQSVLMRLLVADRLATGLGADRYPAELHGISLASLKEALSAMACSRILKISKNYSESWSIQLACRTDHARPELIQYIDSYGSIVNTWHVFNGMKPGRSSNGEFVSISLDEWGHDWSPTLRHLPFLLFDISEFETSGESVIELLTPLIETELLEKPVTEARDGIQSVLDEMMTDVSSYFSTIDVGVLAVRGVMSDRASRWLAGRPLRIEYLDANTRSWLAISQASKAQRQWIDFAFNLHKATGYRSPVILIADEPDQGLHLSAGKSISQALRDTGRTCLIASHSPGVLRDPGANLLHVSRGPAGETLVEPMTRSDDPMSSAINLGLDPVDLLPNVRGAVFVEGEHDLEVLRAFLEFHTEKTGRRRTVDHIKIFANRGINQMVNAIDACVLLDYMDCDIVAVADRVRSELFSPLVAELVERQRGGDDESMLASHLHSWFRDLARTSLQPQQRKVSGEERTMRDLMSVAIRRRVAHRVHIQGISARDIPELLPSKAYNLKKSWGDLHRQHGQAIRRAKEQAGSPVPPPPVGNFKEWLRGEHGVDLSTRNVVAMFRAAFESPEGPPGELVAIADLILGLAEKGRSTN